VPGDDTVQTRKLIDIGPWREIPASCRLDSRDAWVNVPVLPETLLSFELQIGGQYIDLTQVTRIVLSDFGAALQVLRLADRENSMGIGASRRIEDCISDLGVRKCVEAMSGRMTAWSSRKAAIRGAWVHAREIAEICAALSEEIIGKPPQDAYMVGLFHELGNLPEMLDWESTDRHPTDEDVIGLTLARSWSLPYGVQQYFANRRKLDETCPWSMLIAAAHQLSGKVSAAHPLKGARPIKFVQGRATPVCVTA
jgi:Predicted signal transduction protein